MSEMFSHIPRKRKDEIKYQKNGEDKIIGSFVFSAF